MGYLMWANMLLPLCVIPLIATVGVLLLPTRWSKVIALVSSLIGLILCIPIYLGFDSIQSQTMQWAISVPWIKSLGIRFAIGLDGLSFPLVLLTKLMMPVAVLASWNEQRHQKAFMACFLALDAAMTGTFLSTDIFFFYVFWEAMLIPMLLLIGVWGSDQRVFASLKFFIFTFFGSLLMLAAIFTVFVAAKAQTGVYSADIASLTKTMLSPEPLWWGLSVQDLVFWGFTIAFLIKVPIFPVHTWLPDAHVQAPTGGSILLAAVLLKMGTYGLLRFSIPFGNDSFFKFTPLIAILSLVGILYGAFVAFQQTDMKKLVAYSSVSHLGLVVLGICSRNPEGLTGAVIQNINHGLSTGALFFLVGFLYDQRHSRKFADYGGLASVLPWFSFFIVFVACSSMAVPGLNGFIGEFLILLGSFKAQKTWGMIAVLGVIFGALYTLTLVRKILFGPITSPENRNLKDLSLKDYLVLIPLSLLMLWIGFAPQGLLDKMKPSLENYWKNPVSAYADRSNGENPS
ncbi:MAG: NADH-quinone oxidoreductase subunit M [Proteobacteria bacterium]|nr:NADH-quinone oxidoreductase subunit M [Pseudomonadota bacterium]